MAGRNKQQALKQPKRKQRERNRINQQLRRAAANLEAAKNKKGNLRAILVSNRANENQKQRAREILRQLEPKEPSDIEKGCQIGAQQKEAERLRAEDAKTPKQRAAEQAARDAEQAKQKARQARIADLKGKLVMYHHLLNMPSSLWPKDVTSTQIAEWKTLNQELYDLEHPPTPQELEQRAAAQAKKHTKEAEAKAARQARIADLTAKLTPHRAIFEQPSGYWPRLTKGERDYWDGLEKELADLLELENPPSKDVLEQRAKDAREQKHIAQMQAEHMKSQNEWTEEWWRGWDK